MLGIVLELLVVEEELLARGEDEIRPAVHALQHLVLEFHKAPFNPAPLAFPNHNTFTSPWPMSRSDTAEVKVPCFRPWAEARGAIKPDC